MVARGEGRGKALLDRAKASAALEPHVHQRLLDDHPRVHPVLLGDGRLGQAPAAGRFFEWSQMVH